jgi:transposase-like protein
MMYNMKASLRERAISLRKEKRLSYSAIAKELEVPKSTLSYWLSALPLSEDEILRLRRVGWQKGEASRERFRNAMRSKKAKEDEVVYRKMERKILPMSARDFFIAGLMLYVGEGDKQNKYRVSLANSDPFVILLFTRWLTKFLQISKNQVRFGLHLYSNMNIAKERKFWQDALGFGRESFYKDQVRSVKTAFSYTDGNRHGTCTVYVIGSKSKTEIMQGIQVFVDNARVAQW